MEDQHKQREELYNVDGSSTNLKNKYAQQQESYILTLKDSNRDRICRSKCLKKTTKTKHAGRNVANNGTLANIEYEVDEKDVGSQLRNGCDKTNFDQKGGIHVLPDELKNINLNNTSSDESVEQYIPKKSSNKINDNVNSTKHKAIPMSVNNSSTVISLAGQNTVSRNTDIKEQSASSRFDKTTTILCPKEKRRGKQTIAQCITNNMRTEAVHVSNCNIYKAAINNPNPLNHACQSPNITVQPLHACKTFSHSHHNHLNTHHYHSHHKQYENENFASELTNALSSQLLYQITNNSSYCTTNSASKNQAKRQSSFLKTQSLDIEQHTPSIIYHETDDDAQLFFQLLEFDVDNSHIAQELGKSEAEDDEPSACAKPSNAGEVLTNERAIITRSLSLSSQKTGVVALQTQSLESRPIYPNVPYSPYASPYSSPSSNRRRPPLRESRRVSIEQTGSFLQLNQYKLMDQIGQGSYGLVKLAYSEEDSTHYAMKILSKRRLLRQAGLLKRGPKKATSALDRVYREIAVLKKLDHPNVVKLIEVLDDPVEDSLYMVFELVKQGEVLSIPTRSPLSEERAWCVARDTLLGLEYLHYQRIIHGDIKPGNLLLTECGRVKIADLGVCMEFIGENATMTNGTTAGTPAFRPPESLSMGQNIYCGKAADIWAFGVTLYALVYGNVPFVASSIPALYEKIRTEAFSFPDNPQTSAELKDCIERILKKEPADRIVLPQLKEHTWVTAGSLHKLPSEQENCRLVQVNDTDISTVVRSIPKLDTLILIKTMLKNHSFGNPFSRGTSGQVSQRGDSRLKRFLRAGRSNSAPGSYMTIDRQQSSDILLPALFEHSPTNCTSDET